MDYKARAMKRLFGDSKFSDKNWPKVIAEAEKISELAKTLKSNATAKAETNCSSLFKQIRNSCERGLTILKSVDKETLEMLKKAING